MLNNYSLAIKKALFYKGYSFFFLTTIVFGLFVVYFVSFVAISVQQNLPNASKDFWTDNVGIFKDEKFLDPIKKQNYLANLPRDTTYFETETWQVTTNKFVEGADILQNFDSFVQFQTSNGYSSELSFVPDNVFNFYAKAPANPNIIQILGNPEKFEKVFDPFGIPTKQDFGLDRKYFDPNKSLKFRIGTNALSDFKFVPLSQEIDVQLVGMPTSRVQGYFRDSQKNKIYDLLSKYGNIKKEIKTYIIYPNKVKIITDSENNKELNLFPIASDEASLKDSIGSYQSLFLVVASFLGIVNLGIIYFIFNKFLKLNTSYNQLLYILGYSRLQVVGFNALLLSIYAGISSLVAFGLALLVAKISFPSIDSIILGIFGRDFNNPYFVFELALNNTIWAWIFGINFVLFGSLFAMCYFKISKKYVMQS